MAYRRNGTGFCTATTDAIRALGWERAGELAGCSASWIGRCANPMTDNCLSGAAMVALDIETARAGFGLPHFEEYCRRLLSAGHDVAALIERAGEKTVAETAA